GVVHWLTLFSCDRPHRDRHSLPTRRSSDLPLPAARAGVVPWGCSRPLARRAARAGRAPVCETARDRRGVERRARCRRTFARNPRSEEHTSELQSLAYLVCRLLLEKKKTQLR